MSFTFLPVVTAQLPPPPLFPIPFNCSQAFSWLLSLIVLPLCDFFAPTIPLLSQDSLGLKELCCGITSLQSNQGNGGRLKERKRGGGEGEMEEIRSSVVIKLSSFYAFISSLCSCPSLIERQSGITWGDTHLLQGTTITQISVQCFK